MQVLILNLYTIIFWILIIYCLPQLNANQNLSLNYHINIKQRNAIFLIITGCQVLILHAFKDWSTLPDLPVYEELFKNYAYLKGKFINEYGYEIGYNYFNYLISRLTSNILWFSIIISAIIISLYWITIYKYSPIIWLSIIIFVCSPFLQSLFVLRQHLAVAVCLLSIPFILNRKPIQFLLTIAIAISLHTTAFVFLPSYLLFSVSNKRNFRIKFSIFALCTIIGIRGLVDIVITQLGMYESYLMANNDGGTNITPAMINGASLIMTLLCCRVDKLNGIMKLCFYMVCIAFIFCLAGIGLPLIPRLSLYYSVFNILLIPQVISKIKKPSLKISFSLFIIIGYLALYMSTLGRGFFDQYQVVF